VSFDPQNAAQKAMIAFWQSGYDGIAMNALPEILGASKPTVYAAFTSKDGIYAAALAAYETLYIDPEMEALAAATAFQAGLMAWLRSGWRRYAGAHGPRGCLVVRSMLEGLALHPQTQAQLDASVHNVQVALGAFVGRYLNDAAEIRRTTGYLLTLRNGLAITAMSGASEGYFEEMVAMALAALPKAQD